VFTGKDDDSVGETISGSTSNPATNWYGKYIDLAGNTNAIDLHDVRIRHGYYGINLNSSASQLTLSHAQFSSNYAALVNISGKARLRNVLIHEGTYAIGSGGTNIHGEHVTFHRLPYLRSAAYNTFLTNSLIISVTNNLVFTGENVVTNLDDTGYFQAVGGGQRYLANNSVHRNAGTTNINPDLLNALKQRTTYPPVLLSSTISADTTLYPQAQRDTDLPDIGYHYDPIDFLGVGVTLTNAALRLTNGVTLALDYGSASSGLLLESGSQLLSDGSPAALNRILRTHCIQEDVTSSNNTNATLADIKNPQSRPLMRLRFTELPSLSSTRLINQWHSDGCLTAIVLQDCQIGGGRIDISNNMTNQDLLFTNNLFDRVQLVIYPYPKHDLHARNNLFRESTLDLQATPGAGYSWTFYDNFLDRTAIYQHPYLTLDHNYNGYITNAVRLTGNGGGTNDVPVDEPNYQSGALGRFYLPTNSALINAGSTYATNVGLYHFTTTAAPGSKEGGTLLDIGFHYVGVTNGVPIDTDGDGLADWSEDRNGNGVFNASAGETDWQSYNSLFGLIGSPGLQVFTPLK
jgi:hypothetical protein